MTIFKTTGSDIAVGTSGYDPQKLSSPQVFLLSMVVFLAIVGFIAAILYRQISHAFVTNPGLNGLIVGVLVVGILLAFTQVVRLFREVGSVNRYNNLIFFTFSHPRIAHYFLSHGKGGVHKM